jgi:hypothetical protein
MPLFQEETKTFVRSIGLTGQYLNHETAAAIGRLHVAL